MQKNRFYQKNMLFFRKNIPSIYVTMENEFPLIKVKMLDTESSGNYHIEYNQRKCYLHSLYNTKRETEKMLEGISSGNKTLILFGVGLGHVFEEIHARNLRFEHIIVIEPSKQIFSKFLELNDVEFLTKRYQNISFIINKNVEETIYFIAELIANNINRNIVITSSVSYRVLFNDYFESISKNISTHLKQNLSNVATTYVITYQRLSNIMHNIQYPAMASNELMNILGKYPVIIVSAGASLNQNMQLLNEAKGKAIIIGVGTAIQILERNGIRPHLRAALSPHEDTTIFQDMKDFDIPLIFTDTMYYNILPLYTGPLFRVQTQGDVLGKKLIEKLNVESTEIIAEMSIANMIFEMVCKSNCLNIILVGQDLSFVGLKMYADGSQDNTTLSESELTSYELVPDVFGGKAYTVQKFLSMRDALVRSMNRHLIAGRVITNCSEGGIAIPGTRYMKLADKLDSMKVQTDMNDELSALIAHEQEKMMDDTTRLDQYINDVDVQIEQIKTINEIRVAKLFKLMKMRENDDLLPKLMKEYKKINDFETQLSQVPFYDEVVKLELRGMHDIIVQAYKYEGNDPKLQAEAVENILVRACLELRKFCNVMKILIDQYVGREEERFEFKRKKGRRVKEQNQLSPLHGLEDSVYISNCLQVLIGGKSEE